RYGNAAYNLELSRRRANAVADYLVAQGIARARLDVSGLGPRDQPNADVASRVVELTINMPAP
ncbi:OmpA family protein, partial [Chromatium okenii]|uniref:OmpA family protein n=1 Tax=Chromatium okenii TaxID=61644 RepID=UPI0026EB2E72